MDRPAKSPRLEPAVLGDGDLVLQARREPDVMAERLALAMEAAGAGVYAIDHVAQTFWCSDQFVRIIGRRLTTEEALGSIWPIHHPDDLSHMKQIVADARASGGDAPFHPAGAPVRQYHAGFERRVAA